MLTKKKKKNRNTTVKIYVILANTDSKTTLIAIGYT